MPKFEVKFRVEVTGRIYVHATGRQEAINNVLFPSDRCLSEDELLCRNVYDRRLEGNQVIYCREVKEAEGA